MYCLSQFVHLNLGKKKCLRYRKVETNVKLKYSSVLENMQAIPAKSEIFFMYLKRSLLESFKEIF